MTIELSDYEKRHMGFLLENFTDLDSNLWGGIYDKLNPPPPDNHQSEDGHSRCAR